MKNIRIWLALIFAILVGAVVIQTLRIKVVKLSDKATEFERQFKEQQSINKGFKIDFEKITGLQQDLDQKYVDSQLALADLKKTKYIVPTNATLMVMQAQVDSETVDTIRCNELAGGHPKLKSEKNNICPEL